MLVGAKATLLRFTPAIFVELVDQHLARRGDSVEALSDFLRDLGYSPIGGWETCRPKEPTVNGPVSLIPTRAGELRWKEA